MKRDNITVNGVAYDVSVEEADGANTASAPVASPAVAAPKPAAVPIAKPAAAANTVGSQVKAPMSGTILDVKAAVGQSVKKGEVILVLEAMKMENDIVSPIDGKVAAVNITKGESVATDAVLAIIA
jgi:biotin carboxyl carrier protein